MAGLSKTGSISLGVILLAGKKRVPSPAAGMIALMTIFVSLLVFIV
jgi:predicted anti-sigma-YlaC factor YlaD